MSKNFKDLLIAKAAIEIQIDKKVEVKYILGAHYTAIVKAIKCKRGSEVEDKPSDALINEICDQYVTSDEAIKKAMDDNVDFSGHHNLAEATVVIEDAKADVDDSFQQALYESLATYNPTSDFNLAKVKLESLNLVDRNLERAMALSLNVSDDADLPDNIISESQKQLLADQARNVYRDLPVNAQTKQAMFDSKAIWYKSIKEDLDLFSKMMSFDGAAAAHEYDEESKSIIKAKLANHMLILADNSHADGSELLAEITSALYPE